jgi:hypothetical protein
MLHHGPKRSELLFNIHEDIGPNERPSQHLVKTSSEHETKWMFRVTLGEHSSEWGIKWKLHHFEIKLLQTKSNDNENGNFTDNVAWVVHMACQLD